MVSVIIPVFNREITLEETLQSVKNQTYSNWECILVDDGSTDNSCQLIENYIENDNRFRFYRRPNERVKGPSSCRNIGVEKAIGEFLLCLDSDDVLAPFCLEDRVKTFQTYPHADFLVFKMQIFSKEVPEIMRQQLTIRNKQDWLSNFMQLKGAWQTTAPIYKTDFIKKINGFCAQIMIFEDFEIALRALFVSKNYIVFNNVDYFYRNDESYVEKHKDVVYDKKVLEAFINFLAIVNENIILKAPTEDNNKYKKNSLIAYKTIFRRYILTNLQLFESHNKKLISFLFKNNYINYFTYGKFLLAQNFLFKFHKIKGVGLYRLIWTLTK